MSEEEKLEGKEAELFSEVCQDAMKLFQEQMEKVDHESGGFKVQCTASAWIFVAASALVASGATSSEIQELVRHTEETANQGIRQMLKKALGAEEPTQ